jgi:hypothetical protein
MERKSRFSAGNLPPDFGPLPYHGRRIAQHMPGGSSMKTRLLAGFMGVGLLLAPLGLAQDKEQKPKKMDDDMRRAIAFERYKDLAAARQARKEAKHPSVTYDNADRSADRDSDANRTKNPNSKKQ